MRTNRMIVTCLLLFLPWSTINLSSRPRVQATDFEVEFMLQHDRISLHEPVVLLFTARNRTTDRITLTLGIDNLQFFQFAITDPNGRIIRSSPLRTEGFSAGTGKAILGPAQRYQQAILLNQWFSFDAVGTYFLTAGLTTGAETQSGDVLRAEPKIIKLEVVPRNPEQIESVCAGLEKQIEDAPDAQSAQEPALLLSFAKDPVCVRYLGRVLQARKLVERRAIEGLERIASLEAIETLKSALDDSFGDIASLAYEALVRIHGQTTDVLKKGEIEKILAQAKLQ